MNRTTVVHFRTCLAGSTCGAKTLYLMSNVAHHVAPEDQIRNNVLVVVCRLEVVDGGGATLNITLSSECDAN